MVKIREDLPENASGEIDLAKWIKRISIYNADTYYTIDAHLLQRMAELSRVAGEGVLTPELESCYKRGLHTAERLAALGADNELLAAALLYDSYRYGLGDKILRYFNENPFHASILSLLILLSKIDKIIDKQIERGKYTQKNLRYLILSMANDPRVILIKLANHMSALRACSNHLHFDANKDLRLKLSEQAYHLYGPLANRLGIGQIKWELEDYAFRYLEPQSYKKIASLLDGTRAERERTIEYIKDLLKHALKEQKIHASISGRAKHIYSIFRKMTRKDVDFEEIYDVCAIRIIVPEVRDCYSALSLVHGLWKPIDKEFDDYISQPKKNGYRSLHTAVIGPGNRSLEIQIRTEEMHHKAEWGVAAHWVYKENSKEQPEQSLLNLKKIYVISPQGDIIALPTGATPLDFAYHIHTELGHRCRGAKVNGKIVPLTYHLQLGDEVEVLTVKRGGPSRDWSNPHLGYLKTTRAIFKINAWFRRHDLQNPDKDLKEHKKEVHKEPIKEPVKEILNDSTALKTLTKSNKAYGVDYQKSAIEIAGQGNLLCHFAKCCKPLPGDEIIGYITQGHGVTIHREDCIQIASQKIEENRWISVNWGGYQPNHDYPVDITIATEDKTHILQTITAFFSQEKLNVTALHTLNNQNDNTAIVHLTFEISDLGQLTKILSKIRRLPKVQSVRRR